jgi:hypothetical protein
MNDTIIVRVSIYDIHGRIEGGLQSKNLEFIII